MSLVDRLLEAKRRYEGVTYASVNRPGFDGLVEAGVAIERQLFAHMSVEPDRISDQTIAPYVERYREFIVPAV
jgi:hypothetical protein